MRFRIGVNIGDVIEQEDGTIYGDGVNIAARLEGLTQPGGVTVSGTAYDAANGRVDATFSFLGEREVKNILQPVRVYQVGNAAEDDSATGAARATVTEIFAQPAIAVLPFDNMRGDSGQEYFVDGLTEDIITALAAWRSFSVIARNSTFAYKGQSPDIRRVPKNSAPATWWRGVCARAATVFASLPSSSTLPPVTTSGRNVTTANSWTYSRCKTKSP